MLGPAVLIYATWARAHTQVGYRLRGLPDTHGYHDHKAAYLTRLRRIEGQVRGLQGVAVGLVEDHLGHCVRDAVAAGGASADEKAAEASAAIARLLRT